MGCPQVTEKKNKKKHNLALIVIWYVCDAIAPKVTHIILSGSINQLVNAGYKFCLGDRYYDALMCIYDFKSDK